MTPITSRRRGNRYVNERAICTQCGGKTYVCVVRDWEPIEPDPVPVCFPCKSEMPWYYRFAHEVTPAERTYIWRLADAAGDLTPEQRARVLPEGD